TQDCDRPKNKLISVDIGKRYPRLLRIGALCSLIFCGLTACEQQERPREIINDYEAVVAPTVQAAATRFSTTTEVSGTASAPANQLERDLQYSNILVVENPLFQDLPTHQKFAWSIEVNRGEILYYGSASILELRPVVFLDSNNQPIHKVVDGRAYFDVMVLSAGHVIGTDPTATFVLRKPELGNVTDETEITGRLIKSATGFDEMNPQAGDLDASIAWIEVSFPIKEGTYVQVPPWLGKSAIMDGRQLPVNTPVTGFGYPAQVRADGGVAYHAFTTFDPTIVASEVGGTAAASGLAFYTDFDALIAIEYANLAGSNPDGTIDMHVVPAFVILDLLSELEAQR
ncbi:MAG: hypothetical protein WAU07_03925, partial [Microgenomates group bacterium]